MSKKKKKKAKEQQAQLEAVSDEPIPKEKEEVAQPCRPEETPVYWVQFRLLLQTSEDTTEKLGGMLVKVKRGEDEMEDRTTDEGLVRFEVEGGVEGTWSVVEIAYPDAEKGPLVQTKVEAK